MTKGAVMVRCGRSTLVMRPVIAVALAMFCATVVGCGGSTTATPVDGGLSRPVAVAIPVLSTVSQCATGYAHPNICCEPGPGISPGCQETAGAPFTPCATGWLTFPDTTTCCAVDTPSDCVSPLDASSLATVSDSGDVDCYFACGAGGYLPSALPAGSTSIGFAPDCTDVDSGACFYCCTGANAAFCTSGGGPAPLSCSACPSDWSVPQGGQIDLCCRIAGGASKECFSQASSIGQAINQPNH
jgi:hypothetical protein